MPTPMKAIALLPSALLALLCSAPASALIDVYPKEIEVRDEAVQVTVSNQGDRPEYVSVSLSRLLNPGVPLRDEKLEPIGQTTAPTLYAAPFQMSLSPGQSKRIALAVGRREGGAGVQAGGQARGWKDGNRPSADGRHGGGQHRLQRAGAPGAGGPGIRHPGRMRGRGRADHGHGHGASSDRARTGGWARDRRLQRLPGHAEAAARARRRAGQPACGPG